MLVGSPETPPEYSEARLVITTRHDRATIDHFPRRNASYNPEQDLDRRNPGNHGVGMKKLIWSAVLLLAACTLVCHAEAEPAFSCAGPGRDYNDIELAFACGDVRDDDNPRTATPKVASIDSSSTED